MLWQVLVRYHVSINDKNNRSNTALHLAAAHHHPKIVELLLSVGANPFTENDDRNKPVDLVPESDSVTRQMLKSAMANPRPAPLDASMLSLRQDLHNLSMMPGVNMPAMLAQGGPKLAGTLGHESAVPNGIPPGFAASHMPGVNRSFRSMSSTSSVFMDDTKARLGALQLPNQPRRDHERNNAIPLYTPVDKPQNTSSRHGHGTTSHQTSLDRSIVPPSPSRGETRRKSGRGKASSACPNNRESERTLRSGHGRGSVDSHNNHESEMSAMVEKKNHTNRQRDSGASAMPPVADRSSRKHHQPYENVSFDRSRDHSGSASGLKSRSKKEKRLKDRSSKAPEYSLAVEDREVGDLTSGYYNDDAGVQVHTVPGKPSTIEVEYSGGPIIVSVDTQGDSLDSLATRQTSDSSSSSSSSSSSDEVPVTRHNRSADALERKKKKKKKKKHKKKHREQEVQSADEVLERRDKKKHKKYEEEEPIYENQPRKKKGRDREKGSQSADELVEKQGRRKHRRSEDEPVYANQSQILAEMRRQQEEREMLEEQQRLEQERLERDAERERIDEADEKRLRQEERDRRKVKKLQRRQQRQNIEEPEPPVVLEGKPSLSYPKEMWAEPEYDSDDVENEQQKVAENAKRRAFAAAHSLIQRWSEAEDDQEPRDFSRGSKYSSVATDGTTGAYEKPKKPPRPSVSPQRYDDDLDLLPSPVSAEDNARMPAPNPVPKPRTTISQSKPPEPDAKYEAFMHEMANAEKSENGERYEAIAEMKKRTESETKYETVMREMDTSTNVELSTVAVLSHKADWSSSDDAKWVDAKLMEQPEHYAQEVVINSSVPDVETVAPAEHRGLKMRVTGEMPKAYSRGDKDSARKAFMLAPPVGIETSSEASDSELSFPRHSAPEPTALWDHAEWDDGMEPLPPSADVNKDGSRPVKLPSYAKPYKSFGKIDAKVDALEEALKEEELKKKKQEQKVPVPNIQGMMRRPF